MAYNFDEIVNRSGSSCVKYDAMSAFLGISNAIPMWVADMDFKTPPFIIDALKKRLEHEVLGYTIKPDQYYHSIINWMQARHNWTIQKEWISFSPGVVAGFTIAIEKFTKPGDKIIVQPPVYFPFFQSIEGTEREVVYNPLKMNNGRLGFDFDDLENKIDADTKMLLLCNPHNPGGSVWTKDELTKLAQICDKHKILVVSDEIHADIVYAPAHHTPYASVSETAAMNSITVLSHSKTFNVAGLTTSYLIIPNAELLKNYNKELNVPHLHMGNIFGTEALIAAYTHGEAWVAELINYLKTNVDYVNTFVKSNLPKMKVIMPESTFLIWLDCTQLGMTQAELKSFFFNDAKVAINEGTMFGPGGEGFVRLNVGCPIATVKLALDQINRAYQQRFGNIQ